MSKLSVIIPSRNELFMPQTVEDVFNKASGEVEVIVALDGYWPEKMPAERPNLHYVHTGTPKGLRVSVNNGVAIATGEYILKADGHCMFAEGFDEVLKKDCDDNWIVIPARYSLDAENWKILVTGKSRVDYHYLCYPFTDEPGLHGIQWNERARTRKDDPELNIDEEMSFQGSCWFMKKEHFVKRLGGMDTNPMHYGTFIEEPQEIGLKTWLGGGKVMVNKNTWYAHLHKGKQYGRGYFMSKSELINGAIYSVDHWMNNRWKDRVHDMEWFIDHFWPVPTWPENYKDILDEERKNFSEKYKGVLARNDNA